MSRRLAYRPQHHLARTAPRYLPQSQREYLRQRWAYRRQSASYIRRPLGYGLTLVPWGWKPARPEIMRRA